MSAEPRRAFVDTNVFVYAHDTTAGRKRERARVVVTGLWHSGDGCVSVQVLQELFVTLTRKVSRPLDVPTASTAVADLSHWRTHVADADDVLAAVDLHEREQMSFWDAMIVQSALSLGCEVLYTEDLGPGRQYESLRIVNPFTPDSEP